jgi:methylamine dehydrogenase accessory protein MauD
MLDALLVSNVLLWILVLAMACVILALVRQIGVLHERVAPAGALMLGRGPKVGEAAPVLDVTDLSGSPVRVGGENAQNRSALLFFLSPTCPVCKTLLPVVQSVARSERRWLDVALASDGATTEHQAFVRAHQLEGLPYLLSTELGLAYRVAKLPYAVLIDGAGVIRSAGLVNSREHLESLFEARERGVASLQEFIEKTRREDVA